MPDPITRIYRATLQSHTNDSLKRQLAQLKLDATGFAAKEIIDRRATLSQYEILCESYIKAGLDAINPSFFCGYCNKTSSWSLDGSLYAICQFCKAKNCREADIAGPQKSKPTTPPVKPRDEIDDAIAVINGEGGFTMRPRSKPKLKIVVVRPLTDSTKSSIRDFVRGSQCEFRMQQRHERQRHRLLKEYMYRRKITEDFRPVREKRLWCGVHEIMNMDGFQEIRASKSNRSHTGWIYVKEKKDEISEYERSRTPRSH